MLEGMTIPQKRLQNGFAMPVLGIGTWGMGGWVEKDTRDDAQSLAALARALDAGITHIDTAERYAEGHAEELVGEAIRGRNRSELFLVSKAIPEHLAYDDLLRAAEGSLRRLGTTYLDVYLLHNPNPAIAITETMRALDHLVTQGMVRQIGLSNFSVPQMEEAVSASRHPIVTNQVRFNLASRKAEDDGLVHHARDHDWLLTAFRPVRDVVLLPEEPAILREVCTKYGKAPAQVAINWLISQKNIVTIAKFGMPEHLEDALGAVGWNMHPEDIERLRQDFPLPAILPAPAPRP